MPQILRFDAVAFHSMHIKISIAASSALAKRVRYVAVSDIEESDLGSSGFRMILVFWLWHWMKYSRKTDVSAVHTKRA